MFKRGGYIDLVKTHNDKFNIVITDEFIKNKAPNQTVIMIAHGLTGGKLYGIDQPQGQFTPEACKLIDYYITTSEYGRKFAASAAGIPIERCLALGMPRTDKYFGKRKGDGNTILSRYKRAYLYLPTFRARYNKPAPQINYKYLNSLLEEDEVFVVKRHMISKRRILSEGFTNICEIDSSDTTFQYLFDCDVLVTDFSSVLFDAYLLGKPSVLTADEKDDYLISRGMYMNYPFDYGSRFVSVKNNEEKLVELMRDAAAKGMTDVERNCCELTASACDGHSTERVVNFIRSL